MYRLGENVPRDQEDCNIKWLPGNVILSAGIVVAITTEAGDPEPKPMKTLELRYSFVQFLMSITIPYINVEYWTLRIEYMSHLVIYESINIVICIMTTAENNQRYHDDKIYSYPRDIRLRSRTGEEGEMKNHDYKLLTYYYTMR